jgi:membrane-associated phospholipid phosphatase
MRTVDRPAAVYLHRIGYSTALGNRAEQLFPVLIAAGGALIVLFVAFGAAVLMGRSLRPWMSTVLRGSAAGLAALGAAELLKFVFGRSPVYPTYLLEGVSRFQPLHPGTFPSATTAASAAILVVLWGAWPRGRIGYVLLLALIGAAILVTNAHWVSDVVGGLLLGAAANWVLVGLALPRPQSFL